MRASILPDVPTRLVRRSERDDVHRRSTGRLEHAEAVPVLPYTLLDQQAHRADSGKLSTRQRIGGGYGRGKPQRRRRLVERPSTRKWRKQQRGRFLKRRRFLVFTAQQ